MIYGLILIVAISAIILIRNLKDGPMYIEIDKNLNKKWYFRIKSSNHRTIAHSEAYSSKTKCMKTVRLFKYPVRLPKK